MIEARGLYAIYDRGSLENDALERVASALAGGARWLQYRDKREQAPDRALIARLQALIRPHRACLIINDDWRLAAEIGADGVHLGQSDGSVAAARLALGREAIIGVSCSDSMARARQAVAEGATYVSFGRFFVSHTKPDAPGAPLSVLSEASELQVPVVAIGGINRSNAGQVVAAGADLIAVAGGLFAADDVFTAACELAGLFSTPG